MKKFIYLFISLLAGLLNISAMADVYSDTVLLAAQDMVSERIAKQLEQRKLISTVLDAAIRSNTALNPTVVGESVTGQTAQLLYNKRKIMSTLTAFSCSPSGEQSGSGAATISFVDRAVAFAVGKTQAAKTRGGYAAMLANELYNAEVSLLTSILPAYIVTNVLEALKSSINLANGDPNTLNAGVMEVDADDVKRFYNLVRSDMTINNYDMSTPLLDICNTSFKALHANFGFGGISNQIDSPESNNITQYLTNGLTLGNYSSMHYIIPEGGMYFVSRVPARFDGENRGTYQRMPYSSMLIPGLQLVITKFMSCADRSTLGGIAADDLDTFELGIEFSTGLVPYSTATEYPNYCYATLLA